MGTVASLIFDQRRPDTSILRAVEALFYEDDKRFSLYRRESEISRIARGELSLIASSAEFRDAYELAAEWRLLSYGAFTPERPDGTLDLSGIVKALSIDKARLALERNGISNVIVDVGGDALAMGTHRGAPWAAGIVDPLNRSRLLCSVPLEGGDCAIATSGTSERGEHIWSAHPSPYRQVTVLAQDIITADVLATAILAGGRETRDDMTQRWNIGVLTVDHNGALEMTPGMRTTTLTMNAAPT
ncbi:FAD:protein FMN transferase [Glaciibacter superstes]|uniref:FAD:protein FMN transferase n=1 Tax=Glaciibacter superstes TaxID=501023 RepID=UPI00047A07CA|nr:FAD:protein FMN transferase [Glaciibacter superstes]